MRRSGLFTINPVGFSQGSSPSAKNRVNFDDELVKRKKFLLVDDAATNRKMLRNLLERRGHECDEAVDGLDALRMVKETANVNSDKYDVIFMDCIMPKMNGPAATNLIRGIGYSGVIIGVTGSTQVDENASFMSAGNQL